MKPGQASCENTLVTELEKHPVCTDQMCRRAQSPRGSTAGLCRRISVGSALIRAVACPTHCSVAVSVPSPMESALVLCAVLCAGVCRADWL